MFEKEFKINTISKNPDGGYSVALVQITNDNINKYHTDSIHLHIPEQIALGLTLNDTFTVSLNIKL